MRTEGVVSTWGNSQAVRIPKIMLENLGLDANDKIEISMMENVITIRPSKPKRRTLAERFESYTGDFQPEELDTGNPVGSEVF